MLILAASLAVLDWVVLRRGDRFRIRSRREVGLP
jgi:hypothetical protein